MAYKYPEDDEADKLKVLSDHCEIIYESDYQKRSNPKDSREIYEMKGLKEMFNECTKNPGHPNFIPVNEFGIDHLPLKLRAKENIMDIIKDRSNVTVRVRVSYISPNRPDTFAGSTAPYPDAENKGTWGTRFGTGSISDRLTLDPISNTPCTCLQCRTPGAVPQMNHFKVVVCTSTHVIYDNKEAENATFDCFYDSVDDIPGKFRLYGLHLNDSTSSPSVNHRSDFCEVVCVAHDIDTINKISNALFSLGTTLAHLRVNGVPGMIVSHPHGCSKRITFGDIEYLTVLIGANYTTEKPLPFGMYTKCRRPWLDKDQPGKSHMGHGSSKTKKDEDQPGKTQMGHGSSKTKKDKDQPGKTQLGHGSSKTKKDEDQSGKTQIGHGSPKTIKDEDQPGKTQMGHGSSKTIKNEDQSGRTQMGHGSSKTIKNEDQSGRTQMGHGSSKIKIYEDQSGRTHIGHGSSKTIKDEDQSGKTQMGHGTSKIKKDEDQSGKTQMGHGSSKTKKDEDQSGKTQMGHGNSKTKKDEDQSGKTQMGHGSSKTIKDEDQSGKTQMGHGTSKTKKDEDTQCYSEMMRRMIDFKDSNGMNENEWLMEMACSTYRYIVYNGYDEMPIDDALMLLSRPNKVKNVCKENFAKLFNSSVAGAMKNISSEQFNNLDRNTAENIVDRMIHDISVGLNDCNSIVMLPAVLILKDTLTDVVFKLLLHLLSLEESTKSFALPDDSRLTDIPKGSTFILPKDAKFAMRYYKGTPGLFQFPKGTTFRNKDGEELLIPDDSQFESPVILPSGFYVAYTTDTCSGSSGAFVCTDLLGKDDESVVDYLTHTCSFVGNKTSGSGNVGYRVVEGLDKTVYSQNMKIAFEKIMSSDVLLKKHMAELFNAISQNKKISVEKSNRKVSDLPLD